MLATKVWGLGFSLVVCCHSACCGSRCPSSVTTASSLLLFVVQGFMRGEVRSCRPPFSHCVSLTCGPPPVPVIDSVYCCKNHYLAMYTFIYTHGRSEFLSRWFIGMAIAKPLAFIPLALLWAAKRAPRLFWPESGVGGDN